MSDEGKSKKARDPLEALRFELKFLDEGGYACYLSRRRGKFKL
jgi:hypothetical protein